MFFKKTVTFCIGVSFLYNRHLYYSNVLIYIFFPHTEVGKGSLFLDNGLN